ncbi:MAG: 4Fe-4S dicluster domain-containing protein [Nitrospirae bacterium]|nr:MAG: 4Fe-4S dicluster domain-containing protein [Nitrospirota bacterium]
MFAKVDDIQKATEDRACTVQKSIFLMDEFLKGPMCGRCFPCAFGSYEALLRLRNIEARQGTEEDLEALRRIAHEMDWASFCKKGKDVAKYFSEYLETEDFQAHLKGICPTGECKQYIRYKVIGDRCTNCDKCREVCPDNAIIGQKRKSPYESGLLPYEVRDQRCSRCGKCYDVCPEGAIVVVQRKTGEVLREKLAVVK